MVANMPYQRTGPLLLAAALNLAIVSGAMAAGKERVLKTEGDWELVHMLPNIANPGGACVIRSTSAIKGGRRPRAEISVKLSPVSVSLRPEKDLSAVLTAVAVLEIRSDRQLQKMTLEQQLRVDNGQIVSHEENPPKSGLWEPTRNMQDPGNFLRELLAGSTLLYEWKLDRAGKSYSYNLTGFSNLVKTVESDSACNAGMRKS